MYKHLLTRLLVLVLFSSCASSSQQPVRSTGTQYAENLLLSDSLPQPMMEQPRTEEGAFALEPGFYEADFKSYCLQPGTPDPSRNDAYFQSSLTGPRSEILHSILRQSKERPHLDQQNVQLLLWAVVSRTPYHKLSPWVQETGRQLLTQKQVFELNGGVMGMVKTVAAMVPSGGSSDIQKLFELGSNTYEAYERMAVLADHLNEVGQSLGKSVHAYNKAVGSLESRILPAARRFKELGVSSDKELDLLNPVEELPRTQMTLANQDAGE